MVSVCKYLPFSSVAVIDERYTYAYRAPDHYRVLNIMTVRTKNSISCSYEYIYYLTPLIVQLFQAALVLPDGRLIKNL
jgi:hypothetical protein